MLYIAEVLETKINDVEKFNKKIVDSRHSISNPQTRSTCGSMGSNGDEEIGLDKEDDGSTVNIKETSDDKHSCFNFQYKNYGTIYENFEEEIRNGGFSSNNLQEGNTLILFNDDMKIVHEEYESHDSNEEKNRVSLQSVIFELLLNLS